MHIVSCPSCGAEVRFKSHAAVMAVCEFCRATLLKDAEAVKNLGTMSSVLEDYSPIQIGTSGSAGGRHFTVVGRIQLRYARGMWNEWYVLYDDGSNAWLGDFSGLYTLTSVRAVAGELPAFNAIEMAGAYRIDGERWLAADKRNGECIAGQGELPFRVGTGWRIRVADFRSGPRFLTLDYTDGEVPLVYTGVAVTLAGMRCQLLRDDEQIRASAGKYRGKIGALDCPSCGSTIGYLPGMATDLVCPACKAQLDAAGPEAKVLAAGEKVARMRTTIAIGATANIQGSQCTVIGAMILESEDGTKWTEYLVYSPRAGFFWLVETAHAWFRADVMSDWPEWDPDHPEVARDAKFTYEKSDDYTARVVAAAGAFNWRVKAGDRTRVVEFKYAASSLAAEITNDEMSWSHSRFVATDQVMAWFVPPKKPKPPKPPKPPKVPPLPVAPTPPMPAPAAKGSGVSGALWIFFLVMLGLNLIPLIVNFGKSLVFVVLGLLAIYLPAQFGIADKDDE